MTYETVIGLEVHAQLSTTTKLFSDASTRYGQHPNSQTTYLDAGYPGTLPVLNEKVLHMAIQFGLSINATIDDQCCFDRKNYFYPDLPKGYQITQHYRPIIKDGYISIELPEKKPKEVHIAYAHIEEDAGKSQHQIMPGLSGIDLNRAGVPLLEIVTSPCLHSAEEVITYLKALHEQLRFLNICDGNMQEGSFRCDVNLSLRKKGTLELGTRSELKNINSFRFIEKAIALEISRHHEHLETGIPIIQETRGYCPETNTTYSLRKKEDNTDYRYAPDPDLRPLLISKALITEIKSTMPISPSLIRQTLAEEHKLPESDISFLMSSRSTCGYYFDVKKQTQAQISLIINWLKGPYSAVLNQSHKTFDNPPLSSKDLAYLLDKIQDNKLSMTRAKHLFLEALSKQQSIHELIQQESVSDQTTPPADLHHLVQQLLADHPQQVAQYRAGKEKLFGFFIGSLMKSLKGKADPNVLTQVLNEYL